MTETVALREVRPHDDADPADLPVPGRESLKAALRHRAGPLLAVIGFVVTLARSWYLGPDSNWDLLYYHLYKSTSILDGSIFSDVAVTGNGTYLNPVIEIPTGLAIELLGTARGLIVAMAVIQFLCYLALWRVATVIAARVEAGPLLAGAMFATAVTGSAAVSVAFTTFGDWVIAALLCEAVRSILLDDGDAGSGRRITSAARSGCWMGAALALKLTAGPLIVAIGLALLLVLGLRAAIEAAVGIVVAFAAIAGPWMVYLQIRYASPLFPYFNGLFRAPSGPNEAFDDARFGATGLRDIVELPVELFRGTAKYSEIAFQDWRFLGVCAAIVALVALRGRSPWANPAIRTLAPILVVSWVIWIVQFGIYRYFVFGEVVASLLIPVAVFETVRDRRRTLAVCSAALVVGAAFQQAPDWGRNASFSSPSLVSAVAGLPKEPTTVVLSAGPPLSFVLEDMPPETSSTALWSFQSGQVLYAGQIKDEFDTLVADALATDSLVAVVDAGAATLLPPLEGLVLSDCVAFDANGRALELCQTTAGLSP